MVVKKNEAENLAKNKSELNEDKLDLKQKTSIFKSQSEQELIKKIAYHEAYSTAYKLKLAQKVAAKVGKAAAKGAIKGGSILKEKISHANKIRKEKNALEKEKNALEKENTLIDQEIK